LEIQGEKLVTEWNQILREERYSPEEPDEVVVEFVARLKEKNKRLRVLDLGCGAGRHQLYVAEQGLEAHGIDISETGLNLTKERLKKQNLEAYVIQCDMRMLPYIDSCFDAIISLHTIYHQKLSGIQETISEVKRLSKKESLVLVNFLSKRTYSHKKGVEVEENTFMEQEGAEKGVLHHFTDKEEIEHMFEDFEIVDMRLSERRVEGKLQSRWVLIASACVRI
jgi:ubiquinone/menaquinone biosynthesis C-methylase UbiE